VTADIAAAFEAQAQAGLGAGGAEADAGLHLAVGRLADAVTAERQHRLRMASRIWANDIPPHAIPLVAGAGTLDIPNELGPNTGFAWAVHWVSAASFTAGTVSLYLGQAQDANLRFVFTSAGVWEAPRKATILLPGTRMVFVASGIVGAVTIAGQVTQMTLDMLPEFLL